MLASKGVDTEKMWKDVARSLDDIDAISKGLNEKLKLHDAQGNRNTNISFEILRWRGLLRHTGYLMEHQNKNLSYNMYGEPLSPDITNISENAKIKMKDYYEIMEMEGRVSRGKMSPLNVMPDKEIDELLYEYEESNQFLEDED